MNLFSIYLYFFYYNLYTLTSFLNKVFNLFIFTFKSKEGRKGEGRVKSKDKNKMVKMRKIRIEVSWRKKRRNEVLSSTTRHLECG